MLKIDGSQGEGGGQVVRTALSLSMVTGRGVVIENVRAGREKPGLLRQHLTAVNAAAEICGARVEGNQLRSSRLSFDPGPVRRGSFTFDIGSAGSTTLVLQTILPALMLGDEPSIVVLEGGTHNPLAPPFEFLKATFLPLLARMGPIVDLDLDRYGFYPAGGGRMTATIQPTSTLRPLQLIEGGELTNCSVRALVAHLPEHIGLRECGAIVQAMQWESQACRVETIHESNGPGNVVMAEVQRSIIKETFVGFGQRGVPAERVADRVVQEIRRYAASDVPIGEHLADQLLLPMGICAHFGSGDSEFRTLALSGHARTHMDVLESFLNVTVHVTERAPDDVHVQMISRASDSSAPSG